MSADNYVCVRKFGEVWKWAMGFASDDDEAFGDSLKEEHFRSGGFATSADAADDAERQVGWTEYGTVLNGE